MGKNTSAGARFHSINYSQQSDPAGRLFHAGRAADPAPRPGDPGLLLGRLAVRQRWRRETQGRSITAGSGESRADLEIRLFRKISIAHARLTFEYDGLAIYRGKPCSL